MLTTAEVIEELALHDLTPEQISGVLDDAQEHGQVIITSPVTLAPLTIVADDDAQAWQLLDSAREM
jgi:hypothetical protein